MKSPLAGRRQRRCYGLWHSSLNMVQFTAKEPSFWDGIRGLLWAVQCLESRGVPRNVGYILSTSPHNLLYRDLGVGHNADTQRPLSRDLANPVATRQEELRVETRWTEKYRMHGSTTPTRSSARGDDLSLVLGLKKDAKNACIYVPDMGEHTRESQQEYHAKP